MQTGITKQLLESQQYCIAAIQATMRDHSRTGVFVTTGPEYQWMGTFHNKVYVFCDKAHAIADLLLTHAITHLYPEAKCEEVNFYFRVTIP